MSGSKKHKIRRYLIGREEFHLAKVNPRFIRALQLGRTVNALRFTHAAGSASFALKGPASSRQRIAALFYVCGVLYEGLRLADILGKDFRTSKRFQSGFARLLKDPSVVDLRQGVLNDMRNKAVFHVDESVFVGGLALLDADRFVVAKELVGKSHSISFDLSDVAVLRFILRHATEDKLEAEVGKVINRVMTAAVWFEECAEMLIGEVLAEVGCKALEGTA